MTPEEALSLLDQAAAKAPLPRVDHVRVQEAVQALREALATPPAPDPAPDLQEKLGGKP